jgi:acyl-CoA synthetase (AMP-forming)/AMP-acid ligase II
VTDVIERTALSTPEKPAVVEDPPSRPVLVWSMAELDRRANRIAHALRALGVAPGETLVWCGPNSPAVVAAVHGARRAGLVAVPLNYRLTPPEAAYVVDHCDATVVLADREMAPLFAAIRKDLPKVRHVLVYDPRGEPAGPPPPGMLDADRLFEEASDAPLPDAPAEGATMIYTSGTTGHPKGALRRRTDATQTLALVEHLGYRPDDVYLTTGPLYHSGPLGFMLIGQALGNTVVVQRRFDPEDWLRLVDRWRVSSTFSAPTPIRLVCNLPKEVKARYDRSSMRVMVANAAPWPYALKLAYLADFPPDSLYEVYGSTELGVDTILDPEDQVRKPGSCGRPAPMVELKLLDADGNEITEPGVAGELYVRGPNVFETYYKAEDAYEAERKGEFHTVGDIAYRDEEGYYYICDRKSDMIISGGMNVYPAEVEAALEAHPDVVEAAVIGIPSEQWGEAVHAVLVPRPGSALVEERPEAFEEVRAFLRERLAGYKIPRSMTLASELPKTGSGKLLRRVLKEPFWRDAEKPQSRGT